MIIARAPLRISFFGGGTDFPEYFREENGAVLATAIDKYSFVTASRFHSALFDYAVRVSYRKNELVSDLARMEHPVFRECLRLLKIDKDVELHAVADLPAFTGLGSSSTFTVSLLHALHAYRGEYVRPIELAYEAIQIERTILREAVGCQDQVTAALGGFNLLEFRGETDIRVHRLNLAPGRIAEIEAHLFIVYTGLKRRAAEIEARKIKNFGSNRDVLRQMRRMVDQGREILIEQCSLESFGFLLHQSWLAKRSLDATVSNADIDGFYARGLEAGAWGGKLLGAGGGGFLAFLAPPEAQGRLRQEFANRFMLKVGINAAGSSIIFS